MTRIAISVAADGKRLPGLGERHEDEILSCHSRFALFVHRDTGAGMDWMAAVDVWCAVYFEKRLD